ncbi:unnamed protein product [Rotaria sordida]|uniref:Uncharacterized protein n=1 Tax=Rotaria sordida TaxID=392033 RepID=A0A814PEX9_9BILA|nr:unnamed protein product [Rotaria sordida]
MSSSSKTSTKSKPLLVVFCFRKGEVPVPPPAAQLSKKKKNIINNKSNDLPVNSSSGRDTFLLNNSISNDTIEDNVIAPIDNAAYDDALVRVNDVVHDNTIEHIDVVAHNDIIAHIDDILHDDIITDINDATHDDAVAHIDDVEHNEGVDIGQSELTWKQSNNDSN